MRTASRCRRPIFKACCRKSLDVSTIMVWPACSIRTETRSRLSRGSSEVQVSQSQAMEGTPVEVPVPKKVSFIEVRKDYLTFVIGHFPFTNRNNARLMRRCFSNQQMKDVKSLL